ncbi:MAG: response regulator [Candidatus Omnitrophica bacterium]|nr:response regulator [Candidatus Omnitrophota bacterium]
MEKNKKKILVVEDEEEIIEFLKNFLRRRKIEVYLAKSGLEALDVFEKESPDLVLLDIGIPQIDGLEVLREIKEKVPQTKVIMVTGRADKKSISKAKKLSADAYINKPVDLAELYSVIEKFLKA